MSYWTDPVPPEERLPRFIRSLDSEQRDEFAAIMAQYIGAPPSLITRPCRICDLPMHWDGKGWVCETGRHFTGQPHITINEADEVKEKWRYKPWLGEGLSESAYWKRRYLEARKQLHALREACGLSESEIEAVDFSGTHTGSTSQGEDS